jgi:hypothetical protein
LSNNIIPVEGDVVFGHELVVSDVVRVLPPLLPVLRVVGGDADVPDGGVEPNVKDLEKKIRAVSR